MSELVFGKLTVKLRVFSVLSPLKVPTETVPVPPVEGVMVPANLYPAAAFSTMAAV
jgi:hypothetical protein